MEKLFRLAVASIDRPASVDDAGNTAENNPGRMVIDNCVAAVREAAERGADLVLLPEEPDIIAGGSHGEHALEEHPVFQTLSATAAECGIGLISTLSVKVGARHANTAFVLSRDGAVLGLFCF